MSAPTHLPVVVVGGSQAGLAASHCLARRGIAHLVFEKDRVAQRWIDQRWESFCLVTPNWQCTLPGFSYTAEYGGRDPDGFMRRDEIVEYIRAYRRHVDPPLLEDTAVERVSRRGERFLIDAGGERYTADAVIVATGGYHVPRIPPLARALPERVLQLHSSTYRSPDALPDGDVLVVGNGQSGCQIAEDLLLGGRRVHLAVGGAPRAPRRYRGRDVTAWLVDMGHYDVTVDEHPQGEAVRRKVNHYMTGRDGGREIDLRAFATRGMRLHGRLVGVEGTELRFDESLGRNLDGADAAAERIKDEIDRWIEAEGVAAPPREPWAPVWAPEPGPSTLEAGDGTLGTVVWATGFGTDYGWMDLPVLDGTGYPDHWRGASRRVDDVYFLGLPWMVTWGSGRFSGVARDAEYVVARIAETRRLAERASA